MSGINRRHALGVPGITRMVGVAVSSAVLLYFYHFNEEAHTGRRTRCRVAGKTRKPIQIDDCRTRSPNRLTVAIPGRGGRCILPEDIYETYTGMQPVSESVNGEERTYNSDTSASKIENNVFHSNKLGRKLVPSL